MTDDLSARLIALRDRWLAKAGETYRLRQDVLRQCAHELDGLITALRQDPRSEKAEEDLSRVDGSKVITEPRATAATDRGEP